MKKKTSPPKTKGAKQQSWTETTCNNCDEAKCTFFFYETCEKCGQQHLVMIPICHFDEFCLFIAPPMPAEACCHHDIDIFRKKTNKRVTQDPVYVCVCVRVWMARHSLVVWYFNFDILQKHGLLATVRWNWNLFFICRIGNVMNEKYLPNTFRFGCASFPYLGPFACFVEWSVEAKKRENSTKYGELHEM